jgi:hypothetical protein
VSYDGWFNRKYTRQWFFVLGEDTKTVNIRVPWLSSDITLLAWREQDKKGYVIYHLPAGRSHQPSSDREKSGQ